jgi:hypothetical protein
MTHDIEELAAQSILREHRFESHTPALGSVIARLRSAFYNIAARWGDQTIISQQTAYNQSATQQIAELNQRLILADHDLTNLTRTVAELTQQVIVLQHMLEQAKSVGTQS